VLGFAGFVRAWQHVSPPGRLFRNWPDVATEKFKEFNSCSGNQPKDEDVYS
jgi:hypothetical protein